MTSSPNNSDGAKGVRRRPSGLSAARLLAVQALYQMSLNKEPADQVIAEFLEHRVKEDVEGLKHGAVNRNLLTELVQGVSAEADMLDDMLAAVLDEEWTVERLEILLLVLLRAAIFELSERLDVPARVVISEYVDLANAFFDGRETSFVNGLLDRIAHVLRTDEFGEAGALPDIS
ncbi:transcription antitermination factor NusB [Pelagibius litoralis]|uniref:Transcription antitermination protein NusB n=1 Tax=Pelagibius litoralis TaxID=374515 RepID=A0A967C655_9PROT|nr:transcription antitermination factor NusB [Pelagibius litoralis]NIA67042.1 transcription antitermination factor NusB [Pelagibius litoralis]